MTLNDVQRRVRAACAQIDGQFPQLLRTNTNATCYEFTSRVLQLLNGGEPPLFAHVGKTRGEGQYTPPDWRPLTKPGLDGGPVPLSGVSHDGIWYLGRLDDPPSGAPNGWVQLDLIAGGNDGPTSIGHPSAVSASVIDPLSPYRAQNPPVFPGEWLVAGEAGGQSTSVVARPLSELFPPRDATRRFFDRLDAFYRERGRAARCADGTLHVDDEGLLVWLTEFAFEFVVRGEEQKASDAVIAKVEAAWQ